MYYSLEDANHKRWESVWFFAMAKTLRAKPTTALKRVKKAMTKQRKALAADSTAVKALTQAVAKLPRKRLGGAVKKGKSMNPASLVRALDARIPRMLGLPNAVGPYSVVRTSMFHSTDARVLVFAPCMVNFDNRSTWHNWCGVMDVDSELPMNGASNAHSIVIPTPGGAMDEVVPASLTVVASCDTALQTASGSFMMGRMNQGWQATSDTWTQFGEAFISNFAPKVLTAGRLALRPVSCSAYPLDMTHYQDFAQVSPYDGALTRTSQHDFGTLSPIVFLQKSDTPVQVQFMVTMEWRVRYSAFNPASASHSYHPPTSTVVWSDTIKAASAMGHGVVEVGEVALEGAAFIGALGLAVA